MAHHQQQSQRQQSAWSSHPMPPGWEAKYDPGQKRYFFINHGTRQTTWIDPRQTSWEAANRNAGQPAQPWSVLSTGPRQAAPQRVSPRPSPRPTPQPSPSRHDHIPLTDMSNTWERQVQDKYGLKVQHIKVDEDETSFQQTSPSTEKALFSKLHHEFPGVDSDILKDVISGCHGDDLMARQQLKSLGYNQLHVQSLASREVSPRPSPGQSSAPRHRSTSPKPPAPAVPKGPTEAQKARMKEKLAGEFPGCVASVVVMALDACNYDENKTRMLLQSMNNRSRESSPSKMKVTSPKATTKTGSSFTSYSVSSTTAMPQATTSSVFPSVQIHSVASGSTSTQGSTATPVKPEAQKVVKKHVAKGTKQPASKAHVKARTRGEYKSANCIQPKGPDASLAKGPSLDNILDHYTSAKGPNPQNRQGPSGAKGRDPTMAVGPNRSLLCGASHARAMTKPTTHQPYVTAL